ncbi:MAG: hypothetical protein KDA61_15625, partial [Planctomycetales bacterium]|nr:hypothetical protein [Planctomycetales bacterium]
MSALHETTQKRICRSAFAVLCGIPALWTCLWIAWRILPWHHQLWERQLAAELELDVRLMQISEPRPGRFRCAAALLASRGSQPCIELRNVEAAWRDNKLVVAAQDAVIYVDRVMDDRADL